MRRILLASTLICAATLAAAQDAALVVGIARYDDLADVARADRLVAAGQGLAQHGFDLNGGKNLEANDLFREAVSFSDTAQTADRIVVALSGQFATDGDLTWMMGQDAAEPRDFTIGRRAILVQTALHTLGRAPGAAVLMLGVEPSDTEYDSGLAAGIGPLDVPSGVTVVTGPPEAIEGLMRFAVAVPGGDVIATARRTRGVTLSGFVPGSLTLIQGTAATPPTERIVLPDALRADDEASAWTAATAANTQDSYGRYLDQYPEGANAAAAVARLAELRRNPPNPLKAAEDALALSSDARQAIQRDLQILGFDTRGIDGIFGPGSRGAISGWQKKNGLTETGFLTRDQIATLDAQGAARAAEREAEAAAARAELDRRDRAYWQETGAQGGFANLKAYVDRFPDGLFADEANAELDRRQAAVQEAAQAEDRAAWDRARDANTADAYRAYLNRDGEGSFDADAQAQIATLTQGPDTDAAAQREAQLGMDPISLRLVEARLSQLGLRPGNVDGRLDKDSRRAIRRYQRDRNLGATGYLDQATVSQMLVDAFR